VSSDEKRTVQASRWPEHGSENSGWDRSNSPRTDKTWLLLQSGNIGATARAAGIKSSAANLGLLKQIIGLTRAVTVGFGSQDDHSVVQANVLKLL